MISSAQQFHQTHMAQISQRGQRDQADLSVGSRLPLRALIAARASTRQPLSVTGRNAMLMLGMVAVLSLTASFVHVVQDGTEQAQARGRYEIAFITAAHRERQQAAATG